MYGFGDDRNPANDTVNVMEEILVEYITDVVRFFRFSAEPRCLYFSSVKLPGLHPERLDCPSKTYAGPSRGQRMQRSLLVWRSCCLCRKISNVPEHSSMSMTLPIRQSIRSRSPFGFVAPVRGSLVNHTLPISLIIHNVMLYFRTPLNHRDSGSLWFLEIRAKQWRLLAPRDVDCHGGYHLEHDIGLGDLVPTR